MREKPTMKTVTTTTSTIEEEVVMSMLQEHVPLALVCDLTEPEGPSSAEILEAEGGPDDHWWES
jgi:hypothetical protein